MFQFINGLFNLLNSFNGNSVSSVPIPPRPNDAISGSEFGNKIMNLVGLEREQLILDELMKGNIPEFMRRFETVVAGKVVYQVSPDVVCIGGDDDFLRIPALPSTFKTIADAWDCTFPTPMMARQIWQAAEVKAVPIFKGAPYDTSMAETQTYVWHQKAIQNGANAPQGAFLAGTKKDIVLTNQLLNHPGNVAIYGWFHPDGSIVQPLNAVSHSKNYVDYSHSMRLVSRCCTIDGVVDDLWNALNSQRWCSEISDEGALDSSKMYL